MISFRDDVMYLQRLRERITNINQIGKYKRGLASSTLTMLILLLEEINGDLDLLSVPSYFHNSTPIKKDNDDGSGED